MTSTTSDSDCGVCTTTDRQRRGKGAEVEVVRLGKLIKGLEEQLDSEIPPYESFILRLDGVSFSKFTKHLIKPYDYCFVHAMLLTASDLIKQFSPQLVYCHRYAAG